eukprot:GHVO01039593.1.p1 GENE.GHVO01039593.1~~GHVO01039593.1.p1  ORF type:complete len:103 (-),score=9.92 GHVO01039593.1:21-329(-)
MFGDLNPYSCEIQRTENEITAKAVLQTKDKRLVNINITRGEGVRREKNFRYEFTDGSVVDETTALEDLSVVNKDKPKRNNTNLNIEHNKIKLLSHYLIFHYL